MSVNLLMNGSSCGSSGSSAEFEPWQYEYTSVQVYTYSQREREREREGDIGLLFIKRYKFSGIVM